jgi:hypothetical protein
LSAADNQQERKDSMEKKEWDTNKEGKFWIKHYVIGGIPPEDTIRQAGGQVEVYMDVLRTIQSWSGLTIEEVEEAVKHSPDTIENTTNTPNYKPLYLEAVERLKQDKAK